MNFLDLKIKSLLKEDNNRREEIRSIVRDVITIFKGNDEGEFYLPEDVSDDSYYDFKRLNVNLTIELIIEINDELEGYEVDADWWAENEVIELRVSYNPESKTKLIYDLIGELNEIIAHELRHIDQENKGTYDTNAPEEFDGKKYYTQPHELDAQIFGFKRISKLTKTPFDIVVKRWFNTHHNLHQMNDTDVKYVIDKIMEFKKEKGL